jgi:hypothetical protein
MLKAVLKMDEDSYHLLWRVIGRAKKDARDFVHEFHKRWDGPQDWDTARWNKLFEELELEEGLCEALMEVYSSFLASQSAMIVRGGW